MNLGKINDLMKLCDELKEINSKLSDIESAFDCLNDGSGKYLSLNTDKIMRLPIELYEKFLLLLKDDFANKKNDILHKIEEL